MTEESIKNSILDKIDISLYNSILIIAYNENDIIYRSGFDLNELKKKHFFFEDNMSCEQIKQKLLNSKINIIDNHESITLKITTDIDDIDLVLKNNNKDINPELMGLLFNTESNLIFNRLEKIENQIQRINEKQIKNSIVKETEIINEFIIRISEINKKIKKLKKNSNINLKYVKKIKVGESVIVSIKSFPSGKFITKDNINLKIWNENFQIIQNIETKIEEYGEIIIINENSFIFLGNKIIEFVKNKEGSYEPQIIFENNKIKIKYETNFSKEINLIWKGFICIKNELVCYCNNQNYENLLLILRKNSKLQNYQLRSSIFLPYIDERIGGLLFIEEEGILIVGTNKSAYLINYITLQIIKRIEDIKCYLQNGICKLDRNRIAFHLSKKKKIKIINLKTEKTEKEIKLSDDCWSLYLIEEKNIFLVGLNNGKIYIYNSDDYSYYTSITSNLAFINGFCVLKNYFLLASSDMFFNVYEFDDQSIEDDEEHIII